MWLKRVTFYMTICYKSHKSHWKIQTIFYNTTTFKTLSAQMSARGFATSLTTWLSQLKPNVNPRPGGGLSHLRHGGGGGGKMTLPLTRKLGKLEGRAIRRSTALSEPVRSHLGHFFAQVNIEVSRGHQRSNFRKMTVLSGMPAIISGTIIATPNPKKQKIALEPFFR